MGVTAIIGLAVFVEDESGGIVEDIVGFKVAASKPPLSPRRGLGLEELVVIVWVFGGLVGDDGWDSVVVWVDVDDEDSVVVLVVVGFGGLIIV